MEGDRPVTPDPAPVPDSVQSAPIVWATAATTRRRRAEEAEEEARWEREAPLRRERELDAEAERQMRIARDPRFRREQALTTDSNDDKFNSRRYGTDTSIDIKGSIR